MRKNIQTVIEEMEHQAQLAMEQLPEAAREEMQEFDHQQELSLSLIHISLTDNKSYSLAQKALKDNESQFFSREELNQMLPETLVCLIP